MDQGVHAGCRCHPRRESDGQFRIEQGNGWEQVGTDNALLQFLLFVGQDGDGGHLTAGAGGGGDDKQRQTGMGNEVYAKKGSYRAFVGHQDGRHLGDIDGRPPANTNDQLGTRCPQLLGRKTGDLQARIGLDGIKDRRADTGRLQYPGKPGNHTRGDNARVGDDHNLFFYADG